MNNVHKFLHGKQKINLAISLYILILFIVGFWPFSFNPKNNVHWIKGKNGVSLEGDSIIYSNILPTLLYKKLVSSKFLAIESIFSPKERFVSGIRFIMAYGAIGKQYNFALAQSLDHLLLFLKTTEPPQDNNVYCIEVRNIFAKNDNKHINITIDGQLSSIFVNGALVAKMKISGIFDNWDNNARLFVGNDDSGQHSWEGNIYRIAFYDRTLPSEILFSEKIKQKKKKSLLYYNFEKTEARNIIEDQGGLNFEQHLFIPEHLRVLGKTILSLPDRYYAFSVNFLKDVFINIIGFFPLGAMIAIRFALGEKNIKNAFWTSIILCFSISLFIEMLQISLPLRTSSFVDLFNNTLGGFLGTYLIVLGMRSKDRGKLLRSFLN